ncbi:sensor histidine kinase [Uliginosibacterium paludis]|uniref:histidine kinase n=1 Tax=Uliginosibacterium paludis TaxID=1615952 RepID=A0ABV2CRH3_9RHOO
MLRHLVTLALLLCCILPQASRADDQAIWRFAETPPSQSFEQIERAPAELWQTLPETGIANLGFTRNTLWLRTDYTPAEAGKQILELLNPQHDRVVLYILRDDAPPEIRYGGFKQPPARKALSSYHNQIFEFDLEPGQSATLFLNVDTVRPVLVWPRLYSVSEFFRTSSSERIWLGIYCGLFITLCLYSLMAWATTRDSNYIDYFYFLSLMGLLQTQMLGLWHELFLQNAPFMMDLLSTVLPTLALATLCRFARNFLNLADQSPALHTLVTRCIWASLLPLPVYAIGGSEASIPLLDVVSVLFSGLTIAAGIHVLRNGYRPARYYLLAQIPLVGGGLLYVGGNFGILAPSPLTMFGFQLGAGLGAVMIALALAGKLRALQKDQLQANHDRLVAEQQLIEVLKESEARLEWRVQERTRQLEEALDLQRQQHDTLESTNRRLKVLHEERGAFLQIAAHDLKNPTAAIISYSDLLRERWGAWDEEKKLRRIGNIRSMAQLTFDIIRNLLDIDAIESGHYVLRPAPLNVSQILRSVCDDYRERCDAKDLRLQLTLCSDNLMLRIDRTALLQILDNLISNAIKYSPHGRNIHVSLEEESGHALFQIRDEGPGISEEEQGKLFRKFTRLSARPTGGEHSTGLGLSIVKYMTEASGGQVGCISRLGEGATFFVSLPRGQTA